MLTALPDASVDVVVAAQSFHRFTNRAALEEIHRVLVPNGAFGTLWKLLDLSIPWAKQLGHHLDVLDKESSLVFPHQEEWKEVVGMLVKSLFSFPQEYIGFEHSLEVSSCNQAYQHFASYSVIAGNSEIKKKAFKEFFDELMKMHFKEKGNHVLRFHLQYTCTGFTKKFKFQELTNDMHSFFMSSTIA